MICEYGCGDEATYQMQNGKWCCSDKTSKCKGMKQKFISHITEECPKCGRNIKTSNISQHLNSCQNHNCLNCGTLISGTGNKFCSRKCSGIYNNKHSNSLKSCKRGPATSVSLFYNTPRSDAVNICLNCGKIINGSKYCNNICQKEFERDILIYRWMCGDISGFNIYGIKPFLKYWIKQRDGFKCVKCGWHEINTFTGNCPLEIHHIDGEPYNNDLSNLITLCPNCHSLTNNFRGAKKASSRAYRKKYRNKSIAGVP